MWYSRLEKFIYQSYIEELSKIRNPDTTRDGVSIFENDYAKQVFVQILTSAAIKLAAAFL